MSLTGIAALIAAASFAVLALTAVYVAVRLTAVFGAAAALIRQAGEGQRAALARVNAVADRASAQLDRAEAITASMDELGAGMEELAGQVSAVAAFGRTVAGSVISGPAGKVAAVAYGVRHAVSLRRGGGRRTLPGELVAEGRDPGIVRGGNGARR
jgi:hypothetical protein